MVIKMDSNFEELLASDYAKEFIRNVAAAAKGFVCDVYQAEQPKPPALSIATAAGLPVQITYTVAECGKFTGLGQDRLRRDREKGLIDFIEPDGERGARISVFELDRYLKDIGALL